MLEVIGERINTSRKLVQAAVADRDADYIIEDVKKQQEAGTNFIDVNAGARIDHKEEDMCLRATTEKWGVHLVKV